MRLHISTQGMQEISDLLMQLSAEDFRPAVQEALTAAGDVAVKYLQESVISHGHYRDHDLHDAIYTRGLRVDDEGGSITVDIKRQSVGDGFTRRDIGFELNSGSHRRTASGWWDDGVEKGQREVEETLVTTLRASMGLDKTLGG